MKRERKRMKRSGGWIEEREKKNGLVRDSAEERECWYESDERERTNGGVTRMKERLISSIMYVELSRVRDNT
jgi:hypothetical protein